MTEQAAEKLEQVQAAAGPVTEAWRKTELARHPQRPDPMDFSEASFTNFSEIHGDRAFGDDLALKCGMARFHDEEVLVIANVKGRGIKEKIPTTLAVPTPKATARHCGR